MTSKDFENGSRRILVLDPSETRGVASVIRISGYVLTKHVLVEPLIRPINEDANPYQDDSVIVRTLVFSQTVSDNRDSAVFRLARRPGIALPTIFHYR